MEREGEGCNVGSTYGLGRIQRVHTVLTSEDSNCFLKVICALRCTIPYFRGEINLIANKCTELASSFREYFDGWNYCWRYWSDIIKEQVERRLTWLLILFVILVYISLALIFVLNSRQNLWNVPLSKID